WSSPTSMTPRTMATRLGVDPRSSSPSRTMTVRGLRSVIVAWNMRRSPEMREELRGRALRA
ncbi:MAG: hypothetical protein AVDCRST_MAG20-209, partial [uncultured Acidimicrobiales bacterium]